MEVRLGREPSILASKESAAKKKATIPREGLKRKRPEIRRSQASIRRKEKQYLEPTGKLLKKVYREVRVGVKML